MAQLNAFVLDMNNEEETRKCQTFLQNFELQFCFEKCSCPNTTKLISESFNYLKIVLLEANSKVK